MPLLISDLKRDEFATKCKTYPCANDKWEMRRILRSKRCETKTMAKRQEEHALFIQFNRSKIDLQQFLDSHFNVL